MEPGGRAAQAEDHVTGRQIGLVLAGLLLALALAGMIAVVLLVLGLL